MACLESRRLRICATVHPGSLDALERPTCWPSLEQFQGQTPISPLLTSVFEGSTEARPNWPSGGLGASGVGGVAHYLAVGGAEADAWCWALASEADAWCWALASEADAWCWALALWRAKYLWCCCMRMDVDRRLRHRAALHLA